MNQAQINGGKIGAAMKCPCGKSITTKFGKLCDTCRREARRIGGLKGVAIRDGKYAYSEREKVKQTERRTAQYQVLMTAKCPACGNLHMTMLSPNQIEPGKLPRIYCPQHEKRRNISEAYYGRCL